MKVTCNRCHELFDASNGFVADNGECYCKECCAVQPYFTRNNNIIGNLETGLKTYGFELEGVPRSTDAYLHMLKREYGVIPTYDSSLPKSGVEFKTSIYVGLDEFEKILPKFAEWIDFSDEKCGQHINIGATFLTPQNIHDLDMYGHQILSKLLRYMGKHKEDTANVCGRVFTEYAKRAGTCHSHKNWVNVHANRVEFRLSKFQSVEQYLDLICMWSEMLDEINRNFFEKIIPGKTGVSGRAQLINEFSGNLVEIFKDHTEKYH